jgi:hypothetical protein
MKRAVIESSIPEDQLTFFNRWFHETKDFGNEEVKCNDST